MAVILPGPLISGIRGSIGGTSFHQGRAGLIASKRSSQSKSKTLSQSSSQNFFYNGISIYSKLSTAKKILWDDYSQAYPHTNKFGQQRILTGQNYFFALNYYRVFIGEGIFSVPPARVLPPATGNYGLNLTDTQITITFNPAFNPANCGIIIFATGPKTTITNSQRSKWRILEGYTNPPFNTIDITTLWNNKFNLDYESMIPESDFNISIMIVTFNLLSGVYSTGLIKIGSSPIPSSSFTYYSYYQP